MQYEGEHEVYNQLEALRAELAALRREAKAVHKLQKELKEHVYAMEREVRKEVEALKNRSRKDRHEWTT